MRNTLLILPLLLLPQSSDQSPAASLYERGRQAMKQGEPEIAAASFRKARTLCMRAKDHPDTPTLLPLIDKAMPTADSLDKDRSKLMKSTARSFVAIARRYTRKGWDATARPYLQAAARLDPAMAEAAKTKNRSARGKPIAEIHRFFPSLKSVWKLDGWVRDKDTIVAPQSNVDEATAILSSRSLPADYRASVEMQIPDRVSRGGIYFAFHSQDDFHYLELGYSETKELLLDVYRRTKNAFKRIHSIPVDPRLVQGKKWIPIVLEVRKGEVSFGQKGQILWASFLPGADLSGRLALTATCLPKSQGKIAFRSFHLEESGR